MKSGEAASSPERSSSGVYGNSDWMTIEEAKRLMPGPHGVVIGEAYRPDKEIAAHLKFDEDNPKTWGRGGRTDLLVDTCESGATHGVVVAGSGGFKTVSITIPSMFTWEGSAVVFDPSCQVGPMVSAMRRRHMRQNVHIIAPAQKGPNVLDGIDIHNSLAEVKVLEVLDLINGEIGSKAKGENALFSLSGRELQAAVLADILWDPRLEPPQKTLREFRARLTGASDRLKPMLGDLAENSESKLSRQYANAILGVASAERTLAGIYKDATTDSAWLSIDAFADMVCGSDFKVSDLAKGRTTAFVQVPMTVLKSSPGVARTVIGASLRGVYDAGGKVKDRILFLLDEAYFLGRMNAISEILYAGRKYGITLITMWQDLSQISKVWGQGGPQTFFSSASWRMFSGVDDPETAKYVSEQCGKYGAITWSQSQSKGTRSGSKTWNMSEQARDLINPDEVRLLRPDEAIVFRRGHPALRCGRSLYFRRPEMVAELQEDRYRLAKAS